MARFKKTTRIAAIEILESRTLVQRGDCLVRSDHLTELIMKWQRTVQVRTVSHHLRPRGVSY